MAVRVVVITDRRRFASEEIAGRLAAILASVPRGSVAVQVREKDLDGGPLLRLVREVVEVCDPAGAPVWVNDRVDVALVAGVHGVHLPERGMAVADVRAVAPDLAIGCSRHTRADAIAVNDPGVELVQLGPIWPTPGPGKAEPLGPAVLGVRRELAPAVRLVAVGGIDGPVRAREARTAGADVVAVIRAAWSDDDPARAIAAIVEAVGP